MLCINHPNVDAIEKCEYCQVPMCGMCCNFTDIGIFCDKCDSIKQNERFVERETEKFEKPAAATIPLQTEANDQSDTQKTQSNPNALPIMVICACLVIIGGMQFYNYQTRYQPIENETMVEELGISALQRCILVFREIGSQLRSAQIPGDNMRCDNSGTPNIVERIDGDIKVSHPHPDFYGYAEIYVSRSNTEPTLVPL